MPAWLKGPLNGPVIGTSRGLVQKSISFKTANRKGLLAGMTIMRMSAMVARIREINSALLDHNG